MILMVCYIHLSQVLLRDRLPPALFIDLVAAHASAKETPKENLKQIAQGIRQNRPARASDGVYGQLRWYK